MAIKTSKNVMNGAFDISPELQSFDIWRERKGWCLIRRFYVSWNMQVIWIFIAQKCTLYGTKLKKVTFKKVILISYNIKFRNLLYYMMLLNIELIK